MYDHDVVTEGQTRISCVIIRTNELEQNESRNHHADESPDAMMFADAKPSRM
jgi:hypothetical protein